MMLHSKYKCSRPYGFRQEDFSMFFPYKPMSNMGPSGGGAIFGPRGDNLNKLGKFGKLSDATY